LRRPTVNVLEADDVILAEIVAHLHLDQLEQNAPTPARFVFSITA